LKIHQETPVCKRDRSHCTEEAAPTRCRRPPVATGRRWDDRHGAGVDKLARGGIHNKFQMFEKINANNCKTNVSKQEYPFILLVI
jgi:hypothetical protein